MGLDSEPGALIDRAFDHGLLPSVNVEEEEMWLCHIIYCRDLGHGAVK